MDARHNAALNGITNAQFFCADLEKGVPDSVPALGSQAPNSTSSASLSAAESGSQGRRQVQRQEGQAQGQQQGQQAQGKQGEWLRPDVVIVDPARAGLSPAVVQYLNCCSTARRVVYISCNPATMARDLGMLCGSAAGGGGAVALGGASAGKGSSSGGGKQGGAKAGPGAAGRGGSKGAGGAGISGAAYKQTSVQVVDLFPHTDHAEVVAVLDRL